MMSRTMFHLAGKNLPTSSDELAEALSDSLRELFILKRRATPVNITGGTYPKLKSVVIDLSDAEVSLDQMPTKPEGVGDRKPGPHAERFSLLGRPIRYEDAALDLELEARDVQFEFDRDEEDRILLQLRNAKSGQLKIQIGLEDLEQVLIAAANAASAKHGVTVKDVHLDIQAKGPRSVAVEAEVTARKFVSATIRIAGQLAIDDKLTAKLSQLSCQGEGMVGSLVCSFAQPHLQRINGKSFPLMAFSLGEVRLRDVHIEVEDEALKVSARFGS